VVSVDLDRPYANPGDEVTLKLHYFDGREPDDGGGFTPVQITWIGGCFNPPGNQYFGCYEPLGKLLADAAQGNIDPSGLLAQGPGLDAFTLKIPEGVLDAVPEPVFGPRYGTGYVFFVACAGEIRPITSAPGETSAGDFPLGCFNAEGEQLGPEAFVPGYTQVYIFADGRTNANPPAKGLLWDGEISEAGAVREVEACTVSLDDRRLSGCAAIDEFKECTTVELDVEVADDVAEVDPESTTADGEPLDEVVWVTYLSNGGSFEIDSLLVNDASEGLQDGRETRWVPPEEPGIYTIWAVLRDNRGGSTTIEQLVEVTAP
jgi:hypothetical protein